MLARRAGRWREGWRRWLLEAAVLAVVLVALRAWLVQGMAVGPAPPLRGVTLDGQAIDLQRMSARPVLVHFWATWCRICALEQASIEAIARDWPVITVAMQSGGDDAVRAFLAREGLAFPVLNDPEGRLARRFGVRGVPASFIVDRQGRIVFRERGYTTEAGLRARLWLAN